MSGRKKKCIPESGKKRLCLARKLYTYERTNTARAFMRKKQLLWTLAPLQGAKNEKLTFLRMKAA